MSEDLKTESAITTPSAETVVKEATSEVPVKTESAEPLSMMSGIKDVDAAVEPEKKETQEVVIELNPADLKLPENSTLDPKVVDEVVSFAKEQKLTQAQAQAILERENQAVATFSQAQEEKLKEISSVKWIRELQEDKEFGGEKFKENIQLAEKAFTRFATPEFVSLMKSTGLGNHPELNRIFFRIGKEMQDDKLVSAKPTQTNPKTIVERLYGKNEPSDGGTQS